MVTDSTAELLRVSVAYTAFYLRPNKEKSSQSVTEKSNICVLYKNYISRDWITLKKAE